MTTFFKSLGLGISLLAIIGVFQADTASADDFNPNLLLSDSELVASESMTIGEIQAFLAANGSCLATIDPAELGKRDGVVIVANAKSAAQLIYEAAQALRYDGVFVGDYKVNPKILLTTLQKEQSLITTPSCSTTSNNALELAMGYNMPDVLEVGSCLYTFYHQLLGNYCNGDAYLGSARAYRRNFDQNKVGPGGTKPYPQSFQVQTRSWEPGNITINPQSKATSLLYRYTPYVYNGNYNFWRLYTIYFPQAPYRSAWYSQSNIAPIFPGETATVSLRVVNRGYLTWDSTGANKLRIATAEPMNRASQFADSTWLALSGDRNRAASLGSVEAGDSNLSVEAGKVKSGQIAVFNINFKAPEVLAPGTYREFITPIIEGMPGTVELGGVYFDVTVKRSLIAAWDSQIAHQTFNSGEAKTLWVRFKNTGTQVWLNNGATPVRLSTDLPINRWSIFNTADWIQVSRDGNRASSNGTNASFVTTLAGSSVESIESGKVKPGQIGEFPFTVKAHNWITAGSYNEYFTLVQDAGGGQFGPSGVYTRVNINPLRQAALISQSASNLLIRSGETKQVSMRFRNTGNLPWYNYSPTGNGCSITRLSTNPDSRASDFANASWLSISGDRNRATTLSETQVNPGEIGTFNFTLTAKNSQALGAYNEDFNVVTECIGGTIGTTFARVSVDLQGSFKAEWHSQTAHPTVPSGAEAYVTVKFRNTGTATWQRDGGTPVRLATSNPVNRWSMFHTNGWLSLSIDANRAAVLSEESVAPGGIGTFTFNLKAHSWIPAGTYDEFFIPVEDAGVGVFGPAGVYTRVIIP